MKIAKMAGIARVAWRNDDPVHLLFPQQIDSADFLFEALIGVDDQKAEFAVFDDIGDAAQDRGVERVLDVTGNDADRAGLAGDETARQRVGAITKLARRLSTWLRVSSFV
jgi:hypothetical protein